MITMVPRSMAAPTADCPPVPWQASTACPMKKAEFPNTCGTMKSPSVSEKVKIDPATTPGKLSGRITLRKVSPGWLQALPGRRRPQVRARHLLQRRLDRQHHIGQPRGEGDEHPQRRDRERRPADDRRGQHAVEQPLHADLIGQPGDDALARQDQLPTHRRAM